MTVSTLHQTVGNSNSRLQRKIDYLMVIYASLVCVSFVPCFLFRVQFALLSYSGRLSCEHIKRQNVFSFLFSSTIYFEIHLTRRRHPIDIVSIDMIMPESINVDCLSKERRKKKNERKKRCPLTKSKNRSKIIFQEKQKLSNGNSSRNLSSSTIPSADSLHYGTPLVFFCEPFSLFTYLLYSFPSSLFILYYLTQL